MTPSEDEMQAQLNLANVHTDAGTTAVRGMTYEEGVAAALRWCLGNEEEPIEVE